MTTLDTKASSLARQVFKKSTLAMCVAALTTQVYAQQNNASDQPAALEEVVVYGIKQSLQNAQDLKRDAATVKDVITASDINSLPDKSVVEALSRVPGVSIERFAASDDPDHFGAEGSSAVVRGLNRVRTEFNGRSVFSARASGGLNFSDIPPELVGSVEVVKNQTAGMIEGGIAGTINLITRKPFDNDELQLGGTVKYSFGDLSQEWSPELSGLFSNTWDTGIGRFGALFSVSSSEFVSQSEGAGVHNFYERSKVGAQTDADGNIIYTDNMDVNGNLIPEVNTGPEAVFVGLPIAGREDDVLYMPPSVQIRNQLNERQRQGYASSLQWESPDETIVATLEYIRSEAALAWSERMVENANSMGSQLENRSISTLVELYDSETGEELSGPNVSFGSNGLFTHGVLDGARYLAVSRYHEEESRVDDWSLNVEFNPTDNLKFDADLQFVDAKASMFDNTIHNTFTSAAAVDLRGSSPEIAFLGARGDVGTATFTDPANVSLRSAMDHVTDSEGQSAAFAFNAEYMFDNDWISSVKGGFRYADREQIHRETDYDWGLITPEWDGGVAAFLDEYPEFREDVNFGDNFHNGDVLVGPSTFMFPPMHFAQNISLFESYINMDRATAADVPPGYPEGAVAPADTIMYRVSEGNFDPFVTQRIKGHGDNKPVGYAYEPTEIFQVQEKRTAAYVQLNFENDDFFVPIRGNFGLRYVNIDLESIGNVNYRELSGEWLDEMRWEPTVEPLPADVRAFQSGDERRAAASPEKFSKVLPSFNISLNVREDLIVRFGISEGIFVPELEDVRNSTNYEFRPVTQRVDPTDDSSNYSSITVGDQSFTATAVGDSNPYLQPEESLNIDLSTEWYFADVGSLTLALFHKDMDNLIRVASGRETAVNPVTGASQNVIFYGKSNVGGATIQGFEIAYQQTYDFLPEPFNGLGTQFNYTFIDAKEDFQPAVDPTVYGSYGNLPLEGLSEDTFNFVLFYENEYISTRFAYNWRSEYMLSSRDAIAAAPIYNADAGFLDYSFRYNLSDNFTVGFDINNLLNEQTETMVQIREDGLVAPRNFFVNDRRISLVLSASL